MRARGRWQVFEPPPHPLYFLLIGTRSGSPSHMRTKFEVGRLSSIGVGISLLVGCNAVIAGNVGGGLTGAGGSSSAGGTSMGGSVVAPNDVPAQAIGALTCDVRYAPDGRVWRLSPEQYAAAVADSFAMNVDISAMPKDGINQSTGFSTGSSDNYVTVGFADVVWDAGKLAAESRASQLQTQTPCLTAAPDAACIAAVVTQVAGRAFRRPLPDAEIQRYVQFFQTQSKGNGETLARSTPTAKNSQKRTLRASNVLSAERCPGPLRRDAPTCTPF